MNSAKQHLWKYQGCSLEKLQRGDRVGEGREGDGEKEDTYQSNSKQTRLKQLKDSRTTGFISQESNKDTVPSFWLNTTHYSAHAMDMNLGKL